MSIHTFETTVYFTALDDGSHLATAVNGPCFAVAGKDFAEVQERVGEILAFHAKHVVHKGSAPLKPEISAKLNRTVRPFAPSHVERYPVPDCVAA